MPATFKAVGGGDPLKVTLRFTAALKNPTVGDCLYAAERQRARIISRTGQGVDYAGAAFAPYTPGYAKRKAASGRNSGVVDLNWTGKMLQALVSRTEGRVIQGRPQSVGLDELPGKGSSFYIAVYGEEAVRAAAISGGHGNQPVRRFIAMNGDDQGRAVGDIVARMSARANGTALNAA